jgi:autotransporter-associated beta strand protein
MKVSRRVIPAVCLAAASAVNLHLLRAASPVVVQNEAGFEGLEEPTVIYFPASNTFQNDPTNFQNHVDEGGGMFRDTLRYEYPSPVAPYAPGPGWWDGDGADPGNTDRQRSEPKGIVGLGHQQVGQTFEYSFDFRTDPTFTATSSFDHIFQLKATNGDDSPPLATISLYKNGSGIQGRVDCFTDGTTGTPQTEIIPTTFTYTAGQWIHFDIRITPCAQGQSTGQILLSVNGGAFAGISNAAIDLQSSTDFRPKFGFYRGLSTTNGTPVGDSWVEHRTITGYIGSSNVLTWKGGNNSNAWDTATTANFLNGAATATFNTIDQINFNDTSANTNVNLSGAVWPDFVDVNSTQSYTFAGSGSMTGGTLRKDGTGTLTLSTVNTYDGLTDVRNGTLVISGSIGNNSLLSLTGGTVKVNNASALGNGTIAPQINGGTLDLNGFNMTAIPVSIQGTGVSSTGAVINSGAQQTSGLRNVTLTGNASVGGTSRWDIRATSSTTLTALLALNGFTLTKVGANQISLVGVNITGGGAIVASNGVLSLETVTTTSGTAGTITYNSGTTAQFFQNVTTSGGITWPMSFQGANIVGNAGSSTATIPAPLTLDGNITLVPLNSGAQNPTATNPLILTGNIAGAGSVSKIGANSVTFSGANTYSGGTTVSAGTLVAGSSGALGHSALTINGGAVATSASLSTALRIPGLTISSGTMDLNNNDLIVDYTSSSPAATIRSYLATGFNAGNWNGGGINSSAASGDATFRTALGYADLSSTTFDGQSITHAVVVKYTYYGDNNLDGVVNAVDFQMLLDGLATTNASSWAQGDYAYDGKVDLGNDFNLFLRDYLSQGGALGDLAPIIQNDSGLSVAQRVQLLSVVPEPTGLAIALALALAGIRRRRRPYVPFLICHSRRES